MTLRFHEISESRHRTVAASGNVDEWLRQNPDAPDVGAIDEWIRAGRRSYLSVDRRYLGWGVFVLRDSRS